MYLIDQTYFNRDLVLPKQGASLDVASGDNSLDIYIDKYARQLLQNALGNVLFDDLDSNITDGSLDAGADQKWKDLVNGKSYTYQGKSYKWKGLIFTEGVFKGSVLATYTYYQWYLSQLSRTSGVGEVKGDAINSQAVDPTTKSVQVWNDYIQMYQGDVLNNSPKVYYKNGIPVYDYFTGQDSDYVPLLTYLSHNETDYPDALLKVEEEGFENSFGL